jgi:hypothetical protein
MQTWAGGAYGPCGGENNEWISLQKMTFCGVQPEGLLPGRVPGYMEPGGESPELIRTISRGSTMRGAWVESIYFFNFIVFLG